MHKKPITSPINSKIFAEIPVGMNWRAVKTRCLGVPSTRTNDAKSIYVYALYFIIEFFTIGMVKWFVRVQIASHLELIKFIYVLEARGGPNWQFTLLTAATPSIFSSRLFSNYCFVLHYLTSGFYVRWINGHIRVQFLNVTCLRFFLVTRCP